MSEWPLRGTVCRAIGHGMMASHGTSRRIAIQSDGHAVQGNERQIALIARGLIARGHQVHIAARPQSPAWRLFAATGAHMSAARPRGAADVVSAARFALWLRAVKPDALLITSWRRLWIAGLAARMANVPNIVMRFGGRHAAPAGWKGAHYRQGLLRFTHRVYANSTLVRDHLLTMLPDLDPARVDLIWNALPATVADPAPLRSELGIPSEAPVITAVGGLVHLKGFDVLIRALALIESPPGADSPSRQGDDIPGSLPHLVICGEGRERAALEELTRTLSIEGRVHLAGQRDDVPSVLAASDAFVLSSRTEGFPVVLLEAMRAGLPIVATDVGGVRDALGYRSESDATAAGWIVAPDDPAVLAAALVEVIATLTHPGTRARAAEARRRAEAEYTVDRMIDGIERVLLGGARTSQPA